MNILIAEDDSQIADSLRKNFAEDGNPVMIAKDGEEAIHFSDSIFFDVILLDWRMPKVSGIEVCRHIRESGSKVPIILLTALSQVKNKVEALNLGADDYITKPFSTRELVARVKSVLRRYETAKAGPAAENVLKIGDLVIDTGKYQVKKGGHPLDLSAVEFKLFLYLAQRPGRIISRDLLLDAVWGNESYVEPRTVDVHIRRMREKIEDDPSNPRYIMTKRGVGYYFSERASGL